MQACSYTHADKGLLEELIPVFAGTMQFLHGACSFVKPRYDCESISYHIWHSNGIYPGKNIHMLPDAKIPQLIGSQIPALLTGMQQHGAAVTRTIGTFSMYTRQVIRLGRVQEIRRCFAVAGVLYKNGSAMLRTAIEGVFLFSISPLLDSQHVKELLPASLRRVRNTQLQTIH